MSRWNWSFKSFRSPGMKRWDRNLFERTLKPPIPIRGEVPERTCPESEEVVTIFNCVQCNLYSYWGDNLIRRCKHDHDWSLAKAEKDRMLFEGTVANNEKVIQKQEEDNKASRQRYLDNLKYVENLRESQKQEQAESLEEFHRRLDELTEGVMRERSLDDPEGSDEVDPHCGSTQDGFDEEDEDDDVNDWDD